MSTSRGPTRRDRLILRLAVPAGAALLVFGQIGSRAGLVALPFDPHHLVTQIAGGVLLFWGLLHWK